MTNMKSARAEFKSAQAKFKKDSASEYKQRKVKAPPVNAGLIRTLREDLALRAEQAQELINQQWEITLNAVSSTDNIPENTNSDSPGYQAVDQNHLISQTNSVNDIVNESTYQKSDAQYSELQKHISNFDSQVSKSEELIEKEDPLKNVLGSFEKLRGSMSRIEAFGHEKTYKMLQIAYKVAMYALQLRYKDFKLEAEMRKVNIESGSNEFLPVVKVLWGEFGYKDVKIEGNTYWNWIPNRSCEKYASVFRHLKDQKVRPDNVSSYIQTYEGGIKAIVKADSKKYGKPRVPKVSNINRLEEKIITSTSKPIGTFKLAASKAEEHIAYFIGKVGSDGKVSIYQELKVSNGNLLTGLKSAAGE